MARIVNDVIGMMMFPLWSHEARQAELLFVEGIEGYGLLLWDGAYIPVHVAAVEEPADVFFVALDRAEGEWWLARYYWVWLPGATERVIRRFGTFDGRLKALPDRLDHVAVASAWLAELARMGEVRG